MPTILQVYSNHQSNSLLCRTVEFICKQFYVLHRKPFVLQMLGSIAPMLDLDTDSPYADANKVASATLVHRLVRFNICIFTDRMDELHCDFFIFYSFQLYDVFEKSWKEILGVTFCIYAK